MKKHIQITSEERYIISYLKKQGLNFAQIARETGHHRGTISREFARNTCWLTDASYRPSKAERRTRAHWSRSRRNRHDCDTGFDIVRRLLRKKYSPERITGYLRKNNQLAFGHETIYLYIWRVNQTGFVVIGKLKDRTTASLNKRTIKLIKKLPVRFRTITADNGTEFHQYKQIERATVTQFYFANPYHSWERGTNENTNGVTYATAM